MPVTEKAYAKINWALDITDTRPDGYHEMDMLMQKIALHDDLTFIPSKRVELWINGTRVLNSEKNLTVRAASALNECLNQNNGVKICLTKRIPVRAGLGGGSADCAVTLATLNRLWKLRLTDEMLLQIGASLGADVPFFLNGVFSRVRGIGDRIELLGGAPVIPLVLYHVHPGLSTQTVFQTWDEIKPGGLGLDIPALREALIKKDLPLMEGIGGNTLETAAIRLLPGIRSAMDRLKALGASTVRMSGSGSCVFGAFDDMASARRAHEAMKDSILTQTIGQT